MPGSSPSTPELIVSTEPWDDWEDIPPADAPPASNLHPAHTPETPPPEPTVVAPLIRVFAQLELAGHRLAVDADHVVQALPRPPRLTPLPSRQPKWLLASHPARTSWCWATRAK